MNIITSVTSVLYDKFNDKLKLYYDNNEDHVDRLYNNEGFLEHINNTCKNFLSEPTHIIDNIYLGNAINACNKDLLESYNIKTIINVTQEIPNYYQETDINYMQIPIRDNQDATLLPYFDNFYNFIKNKNDNILIHCYMGVSRSTTIVLYYLMKKHNFNLDDAIMFVRSKRPIINPNILLYNELKTLKF